MSFVQTFEEAKANFKPMARKPIKRGGKLKLKAVKKTKKKRVSVSSLKKKAWAEFSVYVRTQGADTEGMNRCVTCQIKKHWQELQAGHFLAGRLNSNLFDERGCHPQCYSCNVGKHGNGVMYYRFMQRAYGEQVIEELIQQNDKTKKWLPGELVSIREKYFALNQQNPLITT